MMSAPRACSLIALVKLRTTLKLTSASSRASRISRIAALMSSSVSVPRPRTSDSVAWSFSPSDSNMPVSLGGGHERPGEVPGVERTQILELLADADQLDRDAELGRDRQRDPALGGAVELGEHDPGDVDRLRERLGLAQAVLPGGR